MTMILKRSWVALVAAALVASSAGLAAAADPPNWVAALWVEGQQMVGLRWMPVPGATAYKVLRSDKAGSGYAEIATATAPQHFDKEGLEPGTTYYYVLQSVAGTEVSANSQEKSVAIPGVKVKKEVPPPTLLDPVLQETTEFGKTSYRVGMKWQVDRGVKAIAFNLYRSTEPGKGYQLLSSTAELNFTDTTVEEGKTYYYVVSALDETFQETKYSAEQKVEVKKKASAKKEKKPIEKELTILPSTKLRTLKPTLDAKPFNQPGAAVFYEDKVYIADGVNHQIRVFNETGGELFSFGKSGDGTVLGTFQQPNNLAIDEDGLVYVTSAFNDSVTVFREDGTPVSSVFLRSKTDTKTPFGAYGVAVRPGTDEMWVGDLDHHLIEVREKEAPHDFIKDLRSFMVEDGGQMKEMGFATPISLQFRPDGKLVIFDSLSCKILLFDPDSLELLAVGGGIGNIAGLFTRGGLLAVDEKNYVYAVDKVQGTIQVFDENLEFSRILGNAEGGQMDYLSAPLGIDVKGKMIVIADRVQGAVLIEMADESQIIKQEITH